MSDGLTAALRWRRAGTRKISFVMTRESGLLIALTPAFSPFNFKARFFAELDVLLSAKPVDSLNDFDHLADSHLTGALTEHHNATIKAGCHAGSGRHIGWLVQRGYPDRQ